MRIRLVLTVEEGGKISGKVTAHGPYAEADEVIGSDHIPEASADVALEESPIFEAVEPNLVKLLDQLVASTEKLLARRFNDAKFTARQVGKLKGEVKR